MLLGELCNSKGFWEQKLYLYGKASISDKIVETFYSNRVTSENKRMHTLPPYTIQSSGVCCFLYVAWTAAQHYMEGMGEEKLYFHLLKSVKPQKAPLWQSVSTNFVTNCREANRVYYVETPKIKVSGKKSLIASQYDFLSMHWCQLNIFCIMNCWWVLNNLPFIACVLAPSHTLSKPSECVPFEWSK